MHRGYTKRWRKRWDKGYHKDHLLWIIFDYFIDFANYKETEVPIKHKGMIVKTVKLERGQHIFSVSGMAEFIGANRGKIRRRIKLLKNEQLIDIKTDTNFSIVTVLNYDKYNPPTNGDEQQSVSETDTQRTPNEHPTDTPNKDKKDKKDNNKPKRAGARVEKLKPIEDLKTAFPWLDTDLWLDFREHRRGFRDPYSPIAELKLLNKLKAMIDAGFDQKDVVDQSIANGWKGLFEVKGGKDGRKQLLQKLREVG